MVLFLSLLWLSLSCLVKDEVWEALSDLALEPWLLISLKWLLLIMAGSVVVEWLIYGHRGDEDDAQGLCGEVHAAGLPPVYCCLLRRTLGLLVLYVVVFVGKSIKHTGVADESRHGAAGSFACSLAVLVDALPVV